MWFPVSLRMDTCHFSSSSTDHMGKLVGYNIGSTYNWSGCNNGWYCSSIGFLFNHALVANTMAEFKYVFHGALLLVDKSSFFFLV